MGQSYLIRLQSINRDVFASYKDIKQIYKRFKGQSKRNQKGFVEATDLLNAWQALAECGPKTA